MDKDPQAAARFYAAVREFSETASIMTAGAIRYDVKPDEAFDPSKVSYRVYGRWSEYVAVIAAAGNDSINQEIQQKTITLPDEAALLSIKRRTGFESIAEYREDGAPIW